MIFNRVGEVRSLIPKVMALTATATKAVRLAVCHTLGMRSPMLWPFLQSNPYAISSLNTVESTFEPMVKRVKLLRTSSKNDHFCALTLYGWKHLLVFYECVG